MIVAVYCADCSNVTHREFNLLVATLIHGTLIFSNKMFRQHRYHKLTTCEMKHG